MKNGPGKVAEQAETEEPSAPARARRRREPKRSNDDARRLRLAELLLEVTRRVAKCESLDDVLHAIVELTAAELGAERGSLFLNDAASGELYARVAQGRIKREIRLVNTTGIAGHVFTTGPIRASTARSTSRPGTSPATWRACRSAPQTAT